ncbi:MAG: radical SAM protein [Candidatus Omnitrophica bacterium]|nr:radical SAM protein [Candidatus Omnitrophota bacterium]
MELDLGNPKDILRIRGAKQDKLLIGPKWVSIGITKRCNINCRYCLMTPFRDIIRKRDKSGAQDMDFAHFREIIDDCRQLGVEQITLDGGEPFLHPEISKFINYADQCGLNIVINTNGTFDNKALESLKNVSVVNFNLSATNSKDYRKLQGAKENQFNRVLNNIRCAAKFKKNNGKNPFINIVFVINKYNFRDFKNIFGFAKSAGADGILFKIMRFNTNTKELAITSSDVRILKNDIKEIAAGAGHKMIKSNIKDLCEFLRVADFKCVFEEIDFNGMYSGDFYFKRKMKNGFKCYFSWFFADIEVTGDVFLCCARRSIPAIGNIYEKRFKDLWGSAKAGIARSDMKKNVDIGKKKWKECAYCSNIELSENLEAFIENTA